VRNQWIRRLAGGTGLLAAAWLAVAATGSSAQDKLPQDIVRGTVEKDIAYLQKELAKMPEKRAVPTLKTTAMLIALYAQDHQKFDLRDQALKVAEALSKKDFAGAKQAADGLAKPAGSGKAEEIQLHEMYDFDLAELMSAYRNATVGGLNIEKDIRTQAKGVTDVKLVGDQAVRTVLIGRYTHKFPTDKATANQANMKKWEGYTNDTLKLAREIAEEAAKGDQADKAGLGKRLKSLDASCTACHNEFRDI
jgi:cytochrome c556